MHLIERAAERLNEVGPRPPAPSAPLPQPRRASLLPPVTRARLEATGLVAGAAGRTRISEEFRIAENRLVRAMEQEHGGSLPAANILMVTSSRPGEGKSFTALNLAGTLAISTRHDVLLVDADRKKTSLSAALGLAGQLGFRDLIDPALDPALLVVPTELPHLAVLPVGTIAGTPAEAGPVDALVERLARALPSHIVVLDTAPCLSTSDASGMAHAVGHAVIVVEAELTQQSELEATIDLLRPCASLMLLLNKAQAQMSYSFGAYYGSSGHT